MLFVKSSLVVLLLCLSALAEAKPQFGFKNDFGGFNARGNQDAFSASGNQQLWSSNNGLSSIDANAQFAHQRENSITSAGGGLGYKSPEASITANVDHVRGFNRDLGYDIGVEARKNLFTSKDGQTTVDAVGTYSRHHGGPAGTGDPSTYGGIEVTKTF